MPRKPITVEINADFSLNGKGHSNALNTVGLPRHRWYFIKEAFSPYLVESALEYCQLKRRSVVVDPFCGSGTVPLCATAKGHVGIGFEVNPFLAFLSQTKLLITSADKFNDASIALENEIIKGCPSYLEGFSTFSKKDGIEKWLFNDEVLRAFTGGWNATLKHDSKVRYLLQLALLNSSMECCNATRDGKALRYRKNWQSLNFNQRSFLDVFKEKTREIIDDLQILPLNNHLSQVIKGDVRINIKKLSKKFDLCITSPPYLNSFDYTDIYRPELFMGQFITTQADLYNLRFTTVRSHVQAKWENPKNKNFGKHYQQTIKRLLKERDNLWNKRIVLMVQAYFEDMKKVLAGLRKKAEQNAMVWLVVSTSAYAGVEVPVDYIIAEIGSQVGWDLVEIGLLRNLRSSSQHYSTVDSSTHQLRESVVIMRANSDQ